MKTDVFVFKNRHSPIKLKTIDIPDTVGPNDVVVKTAYVALNPVDLKLKTLAYWNSEWRTGCDFSGTVIQVGKNAAKRFNVGDEVSGQKHVEYGSPAVIGSITKVDITKNNVMHKPNSYSLAQAAACTLTFGTAYEALKCTDMQEDSSVLVLGGASSVGMFAIQLLKKLYKVKRVVATCSAKSATAVLALGADETVDYNAEDFTANLIKAAGAEKFHNVYDCIGGRTVLNIIGKVLQPSSKKSKYVTVSGDLEPRGSYSKGFLLSTLAGGPRLMTRMIFGKLYGLNYKLLMVRGEEWPEAGPKIIDDYQLQVNVVAEFPAKEIQQAYDVLNKVGGGKIVVRF